MPARWHYHGILKAILDVNNVASYVETKEFVTLLSFV